MLRPRSRPDVDALVAGAYAAADSDDAVVWIDRLGQALADAPDEHGRARLLLARAAVTPYDQPVDRPLADALDAGAAFDALGDVAGLARAATLAATLTVALDDVPAVLDHAVHALVALEQVHDDELTADALNELAVVFHRLGAHDRALELYDRAGAAARRLGSRWRVERSAHNQIESLLTSVRLARLAGEPVDAERRLGRAEALARELASEADTSAYRSVGPRLLADVLCESGRAEEAWLALVGAPAPEPDGFGAAAWAAVEARCLRLLGQPQRALAALREAGDGTDAPDEIDVLLLLDERSRALADAGDVDGALADLRRLAALVWHRQHRRTGRALDRLEAMVEAEMARRHLSRSAEVDPLTDVGNQLALDRRLERSGDRAALAVLVVDLDDFGALNETHGRPVGDEVLAGVAALIRQELRDDDLVARVGGDELVMVLDGLDVAAAQSIAARVRARVAAHDWSAFADGLVVSISIGVAAGSGRDARRLLQRADVALFEARRSGRARLAS